MGIIVFSSTRGLLLTMSKFFIWISSSKSSNVLVLFFSQIMGMYFMSMVVLMRQGLAILGLESGDRDQYFLIVGLVVETETETFLPVVSMSRPIPRLYFPQSQYRDRDFFCFSLNIETEIETLHLFNLHLQISYVHCDLVKTNQRQGLE